MNDTKKIVEYGVVDFCRSVQEAFLEGYRIDLSKNATCPMVFGTMYELLMVKPEQLEVSPKDVEVVTAVVPEAVPVVETVEPEVVPAVSEPEAGVEESTVVVATRKARKQAAE